MVPNNIRTVHQTSLFHVESNLDRLGLLSPTHDQRSQQQRGQITLQSILINKPKFLETKWHAGDEENCSVVVPRSKVVEASSWWSRRASQQQVIQSPEHPWNVALESCPFDASSSISWEKNRPWSETSFPQRPSPPGPRLWFSSTWVQHSPGALMLELPSALTESRAYTPDVTCHDTLARAAAPYQAFRERAAYLSRATSPEGHQISAWDA